MLQYSSLVAISERHAKAMDAISSLMLQEGWRKGPWTALEDRLLTEYVQQHGEGSWNSVAKLTGMLCC